MKLVSTAPITTEDKETAKWRPLSARVPHSTHSVPRSVLPLGVAAAAVIFNERPWITDSNVSTEINLSLLFFPFLFQIGKRKKLSDLGEEVLSKGLLSAADECIWVFVDRVDSRKTTKWSTFVAIARFLFGRGECPSWLRLEKDIERFRGKRIWIELDTRACDFIRLKSWWTLVFVASKVRYLFFNRSIHFFSQRKWQILSACFRYRKWLSSDWERIPSSIFFDSGKKWKFERTKSVLATAGRKFVRNCGGRAYPRYKGEMQL